MPKHVWSVLSKSAHQDTDGRWTLFECPSQLVVGDAEAAERERKAGKVPGIAANLVIVSQWWFYEGEEPDEQALLRVMVVDPTGKKHPPNEPYPLPAYPGPPFDSLIAQINISSIPFYGFGVYHFEIQQKAGKKNSRWSAVSRIPFRMRDRPLGSD